MDAKTLAEYERKIDGILAECLYSEGRCLGGQEFEVQQVDLTKLRAMITGLLLELECRCNI